MWVAASLATCAGRVEAEYIVPPAALRVAHAQAVIVGTLGEVVVESRDGVDLETGVITVASSC